MCGWVGGRVDGWIGERMGGWMNGRKGGWMGGDILNSPDHFHQMKQNVVPSILPL